MSSNTSTLNTSTSVAWDDDNFTAGGGVDYVTGEMKSTAVNMPTLSPQDSGASTTVKGTWVTDSQSHSTFMKASAGGSGNIEGVNVGGNASLSNATAYSAMQINYVYRSETIYPSDKLNSSHYTLTAAAAKKASGDPSGFRDVYGDYFVAGSQVRSSFTAVLTCRATSSSDMESFSASATASEPDVFSAKGGGIFWKYSESKQYKYFNKYFC